MKATHRIEGPTRERGETVETFRVYQNDDGGGRIGRLVAKVYAIAGIDIARREAEIIRAALGEAIEHGNHLDLDREA